MKKSLALLLTGLLFLSGCQSTAPIEEEAVTTTESEVLTTASESSAPEYVWTTAPPDEPEEEKEYSFDVSAYRCSAAVQKQMNEETKSDYMNLITTLMVGKDSVRMHMDGVDLCVQALYESFPCVWLIESMTFIPDAPEEAETADTALSEEETDQETEAISSAAFGTMQIVYRENYTADMENFLAQTAKIMHISGAADAKTKDEAAILLYRYVAQSITDWAGSALSSYAAIMGLDDTDESDKYPAGGTQAVMLHYLLLQCGIDSAVVTGELSGVQRAWCAFSMDGEWYYADPNCEMADNGGTGLFYYGITDEYRKNEGYENISAGCPLPADDFCKKLDADGNPAEIGFSPNALNAEDNRYDVFRQSYFAEVKDDHAGIAVYYSGVEAPGEYSFR